ncbi:long chain fatty acid coenzyme A ligase 1 [Echinococcus multilocularis]|uniref:long-chain-fatty-acid--CoA ligase n=1 Tax=Echinococcus multilocularis TaxID=6211 RepID=A0A068Y2K8_ECHMU|nr:long chain fatty acid coenzyme A ligase 1 [Echinococcus multilocularis]
MLTPRSSHVTDFFYENTSYLRNEKEGIHVSPLVEDKPLVDTVEGVGAVYDFFRNTVERQPSDQFIGWHDSPSAPYEWMTYEEVNEKVEACGSGLLQFEELTGNSLKCVGVYAINCPGWLITELGCWAYGLVVVPLYDTLGQEAMKHICNEAELSVVVCDTPERAKKLIDTSCSTPCLKHIVVLSSKEELENLRSAAGSNIGMITFNELLARGSVHRQKPCPLDGDGLITICYTSGTTGTPKGAMIRNRNLIAVIAATQRVLGKLITKDDTILSFLPLAHIYEQYCEVYLMYVGARIGFYSGNITTVSEDMRILRPTIFTSVPRLLCRIYDNVYERVCKSTFKQFLLKFALKEKCHKVDKQIYDKSFWDSTVFSKILRNFGGRIRLVLVTGAPIAPPVLRFTRAVFSCPVLEGYGCTETCGPVSSSLAGDLNGSHVGAPWPSVEIKLTDVPDMGLLAARDNRGEICVRGASCVSGYYKNPEMTSKLIDEDGWLHTGDVGTWQEGCLKVVDRCKHIFKLAQGEYIAPEKLELVYQRSPLINQIFVDGDAHSTFPVALVVPEVEPLLKALSNYSPKSLREPILDAQNKPSLEDICADPRAKKIVMADLKSLSEAAKFMGFEKVKNIKLIPEPFSIDNLMLTPTQKIARPAVRKRYAEELVNLYKEHPTAQ